MPQTQEYVNYANNHWRELIDRYETMILWNDIAYPANTDLNVLFADYYNRLPEGVVNNRFTQRFQMDETGIVSDNFYDFETPEYTSFAEIRQKKWESCRGIGASFGYNRREGADQHLTVENLVRSFVDIVSKNGNLLLNVGPTAEGQIPELQLERLLGLGRWLDVNGEAIFDTRPWQVAESRTASSGVGVRFTQKGETLYATLLETPQEREIVIQGLCGVQGTSVRLLGGEAPLAWEQRDGGLAVRLPALEEAPAHALAITPQPAWLGWIKSRARLAPRGTGCSVCKWGEPGTGLITFKWWQRKRQIMAGNNMGGRFEPNWDSLRGYRIPAWYEDGKFGIFIHWGVYAVPAFDNEWYPRNMYRQGEKAYEHHVATYGPQTEFGYKDFIPLFKAEKYDPGGVGGAVCGGGRALCGAGSGAS